MEPRARESCCKFDDIPEEQHTGGIVEILGRVIVVACLWRKQVHELQDREVQVSPTPTEHRHQTHLQREWQYRNHVLHFKQHFTFHIEGEK